jgi:4-amino-4-deoxy-L-arabinose transferase-like glycosyltransferase
MKKIYKFIYSKLKFAVDAFDSLNPQTGAIIIFILFALLSIASIRVFYLVGDMSEYLNNAYRLTYGELPYRDFWLLFTPGEVLFPAMIYKIFGTNTDVLRIATAIASSVTMPLIFLIGKNIKLKNSESAALAFIVYFSSVIYHYEGPHYINIYFTLIALGTFLIVKYINKKKLVFIFLSGLSLGLALCFRFYESGAAIAGILLSLIIILLIDKKIKTLIKVSVIYIAGLLIFPLILSLALSDIFVRMFNEVVFESLNNGTSMNLPYFYDVTCLFYYLNIDITNIFTNQNL